MKKFILFACTALLALNLNAQHVAPMNVVMVDVKLDTLRTFYSTDYAAYMEYLQQVEADLKINDESLKQARKQLNDEKSYAKCISDYIKDAGKAFKAIEKSCNDEMKEITALQNSLDKQVVTVNKLALVTDESKPHLIRQMEIERSEAAKGQKTIQDKLVMLSKKQAEIQKLQTGLDNLNVELVNKENDLKLKEAQYKTTADAVKAEIKNVKAGLKAAKK